MNAHDAAMTAFAALEETIERHFETEYMSYRLKGCLEFLHHRITIGRLDGVNEKLNRLAEQIPNPTPDILDAIHGLQQMLNPQGEQA